MAFKDLVSRIAGSAKRYLLGAEPSKAELTGSSITLDQLYSLNSQESLDSIVQSSNSTGITLASLGEFQRGRLREAQRERREQKLREDISQKYEAAKNYLAAKVETVKDAYSSAREKVSDFGNRLGDYVTNFLQSEKKQNSFAYRGLGVLAALGLCGLVACSKPADEPVFPEPPAQPAYETVMPQIYEDAFVPDPMLVRSSAHIYYEVAVPEGVSYKDWLEKNFTSAINDPKIRERIADLQKSYTTLPHTSRILFAYALRTGGDFVAPRNDTIVVSKELVDLGILRANADLSENRAWDEDMPRVTSKRLVLAPYRVESSHFNTPMTAGVYNGIHGGKAYSRDLVVYDLQGLIGNAQANLPLHPALPLNKELAAQIK